MPGVFHTYRSKQQLLVEFLHRSKLGTSISSMSSNKRGLILYVV